MKYVGESPPGWSVPKAERPPLFRPNESKLLLEPSLSTLNSTGGVIPRAKKDSLESQSTPGVGSYNLNRSLLDYKDGGSIFSTGQRGSVDKLARESPGVGRYKLENHTIAHRVKKSLGVSMAARAEELPGNVDLGPGSYNVSADDVRRSIYPQIRNTLMRKKANKSIVKTAQMEQIDKTPPVRSLSKDSLHSKSSSEANRYPAASRKVPALSGLVEIHDGKFAVERSTSKSGSKSKLRRLLKKRRIEGEMIGPGKYEVHNHEMSYMIEKKNSIHYGPRDRSEDSPPRPDKELSPGPGQYTPYVFSTKPLPKHGKFGKSDRFSQLNSSSTSELVGPGVYNLRGVEPDEKKIRGISFNSPEIKKMKTPPRAPDPGQYYRDPLEYGLAPGRAALIQPDPGTAIIPEHVRELAPGKYNPDYSRVWRNPKSTSLNRSPHEFPPKQPTGHETPGVGAYNITNLPVNNGSKYQGVRMAKSTRPPMQTSSNPTIGPGDYILAPTVPEMPIHERQKMLVRAQADRLGKGAPSWETPRITELVQESRSQRLSRLEALRRFIPQRPKLKKRVILPESAVNHSRSEMDYPPSPLLRNNPTPAVLRSPPPSPQKQINPQAPDTN